MPLRNIFHSRNNWSTCGDRIGVGIVVVYTNMIVTINRSWYINGHAVSHDAILWV